MLQHPIKSLEVARMCPMNSDSQLKVTLVGVTYTHIYGLHKWVYASVNMKVNYILPESDSNQKTA